MRTPVEVFHPSVFIREECEARGWDLDRLAIEMSGIESNEGFGINRLSLDFYMEIGADNPTLRIGAGMAADLARAFGVSPELFLNLEASWLAATPAPGQPPGKGRL